MASLGRRFDATEHDTEQREFENLPDGIYRMEVTNSDVAPTSKGTGLVLKLTYTVSDPEEYARRSIFGNINIENQNKQAEEIGQRELASLCRAIGVDTVEESEELHLRPFVAKVGLSKARTGPNGTVYAPRNEIKRFYFPDTGDVPEPMVAPVAANDNAQNTARSSAPANDNRPAAASTKKDRPWGNRAA